MRIFQYSPEWQLRHQKTPLTGVVSSATLRAAAFFPGLPVRRTQTGEWSMKIALFEPVRASAVIEQKGHFSR